MSILRFLIFFNTLFSTNSLRAQSEISLRFGGTATGTLKLEEPVEYSGIFSGLNYYNMVSDTIGYGFVGLIEQASYSASNTIKKGWNSLLGLGACGVLDMKDFKLVTSLHFLPYSALIAASKDTSQINDEVLTQASVVSYNGSSGFGLGVYFSANITASLTLGFSFDYVSQSFSTLTAKSLNSRGEKEQFAGAIDYQLNTTRFALTFGFPFK